MHRSSPVTLGIGWLKASMAPLVSSQLSLKPFLKNSPSGFNSLVMLRTWPFYPGFNALATLRPQLFIHLFEKYLCSMQLPQFLKICIIQQSITCTRRLLSFLFLMLLSFSHFPLICLYLDALLINISTLLSSKFIFLNFFKKIATTLFFCSKFLVVLLIVLEFQTRGVNTGLMLGAKHVLVLSMSNDCSNLAFLWAL